MFCLVPLIHAVGTLYGRLLVTSRRSCWCCVRVKNKSKYFSPPKPNFHVNYSRNSSIVLTTNNGRELKKKKKLKNLSRYYLLCLFRPADLIPEGVMTVKRRRQV